MNRAQEQDQINNLFAENEALRTALIQYADHDNWVEHGEYRDGDQFCWSGGGNNGWEIAEAALGVTK